MGAMYTRPGSDKPTQKVPVLLHSLRKIWRAQSTLLNWLGLPMPQYGYHIPYRYAGKLPEVGPDDTYDWLKQAWDHDRTVFRESLSMIASHLPRLGDFEIRPDGDSSRPRLDQSWLPGLDGASAYAFVRELKPATIIEIGSGHSTRFMAKAISDGELDTRLISIDPQPRRSIDHLCQEVHRTTIDTFPLDAFAQLRENDILFFDGSHIAMPGSDVDTLVNQVLPTLNPGVWVHIHDIFLPHGYPEIWNWRNYNEQTAVAALLAGGDRFRVRFASAYIRRYMAGDLEDFPTPPPRSFETSLWLSVEG